MQPQKQHDDSEQLNGAFNLVYGILNGHATCLTPFIRSHFGVEALGTNALMAMFLIIAYGSFSQSEGMWLFFLLWILAMLKQRIQGIKNRRSGIVTHSRYNGFPWLSVKLFPRIKDETNARGADGFICMAVGAGLSYVDPALGWFIGLGGFSLLFVEALNGAVVVASMRRRNKVAGVPMLHGRSHTTNCNDFNARGYGQLLRSDARHRCNHERQPQQTEAERSRAT